MVVPAIIAGVGLGISSAYSIGKAYDNARYWDEYRKRTGVSVKYPFRSGSYDYLSYAGSSMMGVYGASKFGKSAYNAYRRYRYLNYYRW